MKKEIKEQIKNNKHFKKLFLVVPFVLLFVFCGAVFVNQSADISRMEKQKGQLLAQLESKKADNARLQQIVDSDDKNEYIEQKAREKGYVKGDEIVFYDISGA